MNILLKLIHKEWTKEQWNSFYQFVKFCLIGVSNTLISYGINVLVLIAMKPMEVSWDYFVANIVAFLLSVLWSFYWNNKYVFTKGAGETRSLWKALLKTYISYGVSGIVIANILSFIWIDVIGISKYIAPLLNLVVSVPINFILNKLWAFKTETKDA